MTSSPESIASNSGNSTPGALHYRNLSPRARSEVLDFAQLWSTTRQHYGFVLGVALATFASVMALTLGSHMQFRSVGRLYLGELEQSNSSAATRSNEIDLSANSQGAAGSEVEIISSRSLVARAIVDSGLNVTITRAGKPLPRYGAWLWSRRNAVLLDSAEGELHATNSSLTDEYGKERSYGIRFADDTAYEVWAGEQRVGNGRLGEAAVVPGAKWTLLPGSKHTPAPGARYDLQIYPISEVTDSALLALQVSTSKPLPPAQPVNVVTLEFSAKSPRSAARFLDSLMAGYLSERQAWKVENATAAEAFVTDQLKTTRSTLDDFEKQLARYRSSNRVVVTDSEAKAMIEQIGRYEEQRVAARMAVAELNQLQKGLEGADPPVGALLLGGTTDTVVERMATSLSEARQRLTDLESRFNDAAPDIKAEKGQIDSQLQSIRNYVSSRAARARANLSTIDSIIKQFESKLDTVPGAEVGLAQLARESDVYGRMYTYLLERQQQTAIIKASTLSKNRVLDAPEISTREDSPKLLLRLASLPLGLLIGVCLVLARSFLASTFQTEADVRNVALGLPIFASLPWRAKHPRNQRAAPHPQDLLGGDTTSSFAEALRVLRTNLYRSFGGASGQVLQITSPNPGDGKTTAALALAAILAGDKRRVLVVDSDFRKGNPAASTGVLGLSEVLAGTCSWDEAVYPVPIANGEFYALGCGESAEPELLSSPGMVEFLRDARARFDFVLLDVQSFPLASDALVLSMVTDATLSVFRLQNTARKLASEHLLGLASVTLTHAVLLNDAGLERSASKMGRRRAIKPAPPEGRVSKHWRKVLWVSAVFLLAWATAFVLFRKPLLSMASRTASELKQ